MSTLLKFLGGLAFGGLAYVALTDDADASSGGAWDHLFEAFWWTAGREESRNRINDWRNIRNRWASIGWMHFSQSHSITLLMDEAMQDDIGQFRQVFGDQSGNFENLKWVRNANLNQEPNQSLLVAWLGSSWGEEIQRRVAAKYYFNPTMEMIDRARPDADDVYRVVVASTRIFASMDDVEPAVGSYATAEAFTEAFKQQYAGQEVWHRFDRQLQNARSMVMSGALANR